MRSCPWRWTGRSIVQHLRWLTQHHVMKTIGTVQTLGLQVDANGFWRWFVFRVIEFMDFFHRTVFEISSLKGTQLFRFITPQSPPPLLLFFTWRRKQNPLSIHSHFNILAFVLYRTMEKVHELNNSGLGLQLTVWWCGRRWIGRRSLYAWPPRSPNLTTPWFVFVGTLEWFGVSGEIGNTNWARKRILDCVSAMRNNRESIRIATGLVLKWSR